MSKVDRKDIEAKFGELFPQIWKKRIAVAVSVSGYPNEIVALLDDHTVATFKYTDEKHYSIRVEGQ